MRMSALTKPVTSDSNSELSDWLFTAASALSAKRSVPNKPMVPTAPTPLNHYSPPSGRRHIGQSLDRPKLT
jgi:hypothetical protein